MKSDPFDFGVAFDDDDIAWPCFFSPLLSMVVGISRRRSTKN